jgi:hypothetical protein
MPIVFAGLVGLLLGAALAWFASPLLVGVGASADVVLGAGVLLGAGAGASSRTMVEVRGDPRGLGAIMLSRPFGVVLAFAGFVWLPVVGYFVAFHPDWSYLYLVPHRQVPSAIDLTLVLLAGGAVLLGFLAAVGPVRKRHFASLMALVVVPGALVVLALPFCAKRLTVSGTYAQFHGDFGTEPISSSLLGKGVLLMGIILAAGVGWTLLSLSRMASETTR